MRRKAYYETRELKFLKSAKNDCLRDASRYAASLKFIDNNGGVICDIF